MEKTIDEIIQGIEVIKAQAEWEYPLDWQIVLDGAIDNMRKYQMFQAKYVERLKADMVDMFEELKKKIEKNGIVDFEETYVDDGECIISVSECNRLIQQKINALKGD